MRKVLDDRGMETAISMVMLILGASLLFSFAHDGGVGEQIDTGTFQLRCVQAGNMAFCIKESLSQVNGQFNGTVWVLLREQGLTISEGEDPNLVHAMECLHPYRPDGIDVLISISSERDLPDPVLTPHVVSGTVLPGSVHIRVYLPLERGSFNYDVGGAL
ncbi:MAG: hypothetical protein KAH57_00815 [Thermoplasmata archaeon]|nr:hypothetical protein [Thermoplasmata archaeon]